MRQVKEQIIEMFDCLPESEQRVLLLEIVKQFADDALTPTERRELEEAERSIKI